MQEDPVSVKNTMFTFSIGADHGGLDLKNQILTFLAEGGYTYKDNGTHTAESVDYPDYAALVGADVVQGRAQFGLLICRSGMGVCIAANKIKSIRAVLVKLEDDAEYARRHNNANVMCLGGKHTTLYLAQKFIKLFLATPFDTGRHSVRLEKIAQMEC